MVYGWLAGITRRLYPPHCVLCSQPSRRARELCDACARDLPWNRHPCPRCALPLPADIAAPFCGRCLKSPPAWDCAASPLLYDWPLDQLLQRFKFKGDLATGRLLGELLAEFAASLPLTRPELLIAMPLHPARLCERGFNQALELARPLSRRLGLRLDTRACLRRKNTAVQSKLTAVERRRNLRDAFEVRTSLQGVHVGVVDDVVTTGATVAALSRALREAGAARITVWSLARAARSI